ncbi:MAG TPA: hypothetical protein VJP02_04595 [Candidatus Sulfotelmatobacter sp.]|nr:hypothetical protein [Candidatus Sulfotelmatobacter sp.]
MTTKMGLKPADVQFSVIEKATGKCWSNVGLSTAAPYVDNANFEVLVWVPVETVLSGLPSRVQAQSERIQ